MKPEETVDFHIRWAWYKIARMYNYEAAKFNSTMAVGYALLSIDFENGTPSTKLGPQMGMEPRSLTRLLKSMEEKGLIFKKSDKNDRRVVYIHLSDFGKEKREIAKQTVLNFNNLIYQKIPQARLNLFFEVMNKINLILDGKQNEKNGISNRF